MAVSGDNVTIGCQYYCRS